MNHRRLRGAAALASILAGALAAGCGGAAAAGGLPPATATTPPAPPSQVSPPPSSSSPSPTASRPYGTPCRLSQLRVLPGPRVSEATQQNTVLLVLRNVSPAGCDLSGFPAISLRSASGPALAFRYRRGRDQMLGYAPPSVVPLAPGASAFLAINKNACVTHPAGQATGIEVTPPGDQRPLTLALPPADQSQMGYCGAGDPGHTVDVSPVEPAAAAVFGSH